MYGKHNNSCRLPIEASYEQPVLPFALIKIFNGHGKRQTTLNLDCLPLVTS